MTIPKRFLPVLKTLCFLLFLCVFFICIQDLSIEKKGDNYQLQKGFFQEPPGCLDVVYIGASPTFTSWSAPIAYKKYGITSWTYSNNSQPFVSLQSFLKLAYRRQPNAVFMLCLNGLYNDTELPVDTIHSTTDSFKASVEKIKLINQICTDFQTTPEGYLEILFPIVRYHSRWDDPAFFPFQKIEKPYKGAFNNPVFFTATDISSNKVTTDQRGQLPDFTQKALDDLLDYCASKNIKAVFVLSAQYRDEQTMQWYNTMIDEIEAKGFFVVNEFADFDKIGLDDTKDFFDANHTNIHGALKITDYLSQYLLDHYSFLKKSDDGYESWDEAYDKYKAIIAPYLTEEELSKLP